MVGIVGIRDVGRRRTLTVRQDRTAWQTLDSVLFLRRRTSPSSTLPQHCPHPMPSTRWVPVQVWRRMPTRSLGHTGEIAVSSSSTTIMPPTCSRDTRGGDTMAHFNMANRLTTTTTTGRMQRRNDIESGEAGSSKSRWTRWTRHTRV